MWIYNHDAPSSSSPNMSSLNQTCNNKNTSNKSNILTMPPHWSTQLDSILVSYEEYSVATNNIASCIPYNEHCNKEYKIKCYLDKPSSGIAFDKAITLLFDQIMYGHIVTFFTRICGKEILQIWLTHILIPLETSYI